MGAKLGAVCAENESVDDASAQVSLAQSVMVAAGLFRCKEETAVSGQAAADVLEAGLTFSATLRRAERPLRDAAHLAADTAELGYPAHPPVPPRPAQAPGGRLAYPVRTCHRAAE